VLANVRLFIGADSGMMHLAVAAGVTTVGLFSITKMDVYAPYGNLNKGIDTTRVTMDQLMDEINASLPQLN
jgi:ADP-heptose:LPS heptosyltransferase